MSTCTNNVIFINLLLINVDSLDRLVFVGCSVPLSPAAPLIPNGKNAVNLLYYYLVQRSNVTSKKMPKENVYMRYAMLIVLKLISFYAFTMNVRRACIAYFLYYCYWPLSTMSASPALRHCSGNSVLSPIIIAILPIDGNCIVTEYFLISSFCRREIATEYFSCAFPHVHWLCPI